MIDDPRDQGAMYLHRSHRAKFLTAEAGDAGLVIDGGEVVFHYDRVCRADLCTFFASDTTRLADFSLYNRFFQ